MRGVSDYAVVYDITDDRERARVDKVLKGFGFRVQKSVFECRLGKEARDRLISRLDALGIATGHVKVYRLDYASKRTIIGKPPAPNADDGSAFIV